MVTLKDSRHGLAKNGLTEGRYARTGLEWSDRGTVGPDRLRMV